MLGEFIGFIYSITSWFSSCHFSWLKYLLRRGLLCYINPSFRFNCLQNLLAIAWEILSQSSAQISCWFSKYDFIFSLRVPLFRNNCYSCLQVGMSLSCSLHSLNLFFSEFLSGLSALLFMCHLSFIERVNS